jgi:two-component system, NtrC family, sensor kinase
MKYLLFFFLFICNFSSYGQIDNIFRVDSLTSEGVLLDKGWKWHKGDNPEWAKAVIDDKNWDAINPATSIPQLSQMKTEGFIWLRLQFTIINPVKDQLSLAIEQSGASQIFLNGKRIKDYGVISNNSSEIIAYNPLRRPLLFYLDTAVIQTMAIRYAFQPGINYKPIIEVNYPLLRVTLSTPEPAIDRYNNGMSIFIQSFLMGLFLMLFIFHIILFFSYRSLKSNLYLSLYALLLVIAGILHIILLSTNAVWDRNSYSIAMLVFNNMAVIALGYSLYFLLKRKSKYIGYSVILIMIISTSNSLFGRYTSLDYIQFSSLILLSLLYVLLAINAYRQKVNGALFIVIGITLSIIVTALLVISVVFGYSGNVVGALWLLAQIIFPISISFVLGLEFKFINRSLKQRLEEVKRLSEEKQEILELQKESLEQQVQVRTSELNQSLENLKSTQSQLIQSEKMASLGELTAGIAHEIQNPLNFVNNFSEVNKELIEELQQERKKDIRDFNNEDDILNDIKENEGKINHHGKRADAIVKGMLQHSRSSSGVKEPTDINALADEYLRLAYHGLRAKDKSFNAIWKTDFDENIGNINIIPQDIGRVILNLINNAFYAAPLPPEGGFKDPDYKHVPAVWVSTKKVGDKVLISVRDNGPGIPQKILDKIFQPFFTTKPTGQGTGLGLSLAYDIIKAHGGSLKAETKEGEGSEFIITLPLHD